MTHKTHEPHSFGGDDVIKALLAIIIPIVTSLIQEQIKAAMTPTPVETTQDAPK